MTRSRVPNVATVALAVCGLTIALGASAAQALFLPLASFGGPGSAAGAFQTPMGVAIDQTSGDVYVADSGNARVQKFDADGNFISAFGWGVADGMAQSEVCTSNCLAGIVGSGDGQFTNPTTIAVDSSGGSSAGDVYVGDLGRNVVLKFDSAGNFLATIDGSTTPQGPFVSLAGVSVDQNGHLWTADGTTDNITEFDENGGFVQQWTDPFGQTVAIAVDATNAFVYLIRGSAQTERFNLTGGDETVIDNGTGVALAVDPATGLLLVDHGSDVTVYDSTGAQVDNFTLTGSSSMGLAFGSTAGHAYVSDTSANNITIYGPPTTPGPPFIQSESATDFTETGATLHATIVPFGLATTCQFQYVDDAAFQATGYATATSVPCVPADLGDSFTFVQVSADITGLTSGVTYHFRAVAMNSAGTTNGADMTFTTVGPPLVVSESASNITDTSAILNATINPLGLDTTCVFQYVTDAAFQMSEFGTATSVDCAPFDLGSSFTNQTTSAGITGLTPETTYHFRVVATNSDGTTNGDDETFVTLVSFLVRLDSFGTSGTGSGQFQGANGVAVYQKGGRVYVVDTGNARVQKFNRDGRFVAAFGWGVKDGQAVDEICKSKTSCQAGIPGSGPGQFLAPTSIAVDSNAGPSKGFVYVGDAGNNAILKFSQNGKYLATIDGSSTPQGHFVALSGVSVDQSGNLWASDAGTNNVIEFDHNGNFVQQWTAPGSPSAIVVDSVRGAVYLVVFGTTDRFNLTGGDLKTIDTGFASALALDPQTGNLYVDHGADVAVYDPTGLRIDTLFSLGDATNSQGLAYLSTGKGSNAGRKDRLYVSDTVDNTVTIYGPHGPGAPFITAQSATSAGKTTEVLHASIVPLGRSTSCTFQYVTATDFNSSGYANAISVPCTPADLGKSFTPQQASATITGLTLGAFYHFRVVATNSNGTTTGADQTFQAGPGDWTPFTRCPVDDPLMLATDGVNSIAVCLASNSTHGSITIGSTTTVTGNTNLQVGLVANQGIFTVVPGVGGSVISDPVQVTAGGITVTATVESAGDPSDFDLIAGLQTGVPIIRLPIKIHLVGTTVDLGPSCFIGSEANPIVLNPENTDLSNSSARIETFDPDGTPNPNGPLTTIVITGAVQGDNTFAVPGAEGCGPNGDGSLNSAVNTVVGLPSPSGANHLVLDDASSALAISSVTGQQFSDFWHLAFD